MTTKTITKNYIELIANSNIVTGVSLGLVATYIPFSLTFALSRACQLSCSSDKGTIAVLGLAALMVAGVAIYDARKSTKSVLVFASMLFAMIGVLVSLTV